MRITKFTTPNRPLVAVFATLFVFVFLQPPIRAEQLPLKSFTVADGLPNNFVQNVFEDRNGFIWMATGDGLSLFDGYRFKQFDSRDGLPATPIRSITEDDHGRLWIATYRGISRLSKRVDYFQFGSDAAPRFETFLMSSGGTLFDKLKNQISRILFDSSGTLWCLTDFGLYRSSNPDAEVPVFEAVVERDMAFSAGAFRDADGTLWFGLGDELFDIRDGTLRSRGSAGQTYPGDVITAISRDADGRLLVGTAKKVLAFEASATQSTGTFREIYSPPPRVEINTLLAVDGGAVWVATGRGLVKLVGDRVTTITNLDSSPTQNVAALSTDRHRNVWISLLYNGVRLLESEAIVNYIPDGSVNKSVGDAIQDSRGRIWAMLDEGRAAVIENGELVGRDFTEAVPSQPSAWFGRSDKGWFYGSQNQFIKVPKPLLRLRDGRIFDVSRLIEFKKPIGAIAQGSRFYETSDGNLWMANADGRIMRLKIDGPEIARSKSLGAEFTFGYFGSRLESDGRDGLWLLHPLFIGRLRNETYQPVATSDGLPERDPRSVFTDSRGWLWIGLRNKGVAVTRTPAADEPVFTNYSKQNSPIRSNAVRSIAEDNLGRMYFATDNGISRMNVGTSEWTFFSSNDGLAGNVVFGVTRDREGFMWASTEGGLSRIDLSLEKSIQNPPPIFLTSVEVAGKDLLLPLTGVDAIPKLVLGPTDNNLTIGFVAPNPSDDGLTYQFRLNDGDWSRPSGERAVSFSNLVDGDYRFEVRATDRNGAVNNAPTSFAFEIRPPFWKQWWFVAGVAILTMLAAYLFYRGRVRRLLMIERTRTRIATDLHDDIGTNLSNISFLSELVRLQTSGGDDETERMLRVIGETSRESVGAMSDIVWAINPEKDTLSDITRRMRQHTEEVFLDHRAKVVFSSGDGEQDIRVSMDVRRELYLIFKEALNNAVKYSGARNVAVSLGLEDEMLVLRVEDNGVGFDPSVETTGNGLRNIRSRAARIGAEIHLESTAGEGTKIVVRHGNSGRPI